MDIVSKNGNLLLNVVQRPDGSLDPEAERLLADLAAWMKVNGAAIHETRPWMICGEGKAAVDGIGKEERLFSAEDLRFTQSKNGDTLYAIALGLPREAVRIRSLARRPVASVRLLGSDEKLVWKQETDALVITPPSKLPCDHAITFSITVREP